MISIDLVHWHYWLALFVYSLSGIFFSFLSRYNENWFYLAAIASFIVTVAVGIVYSVVQSII